MTTKPKKMRSGPYAMLVVLGYRAKLVWNRLRGRSFELPNYTQLEQDLFIGGRSKSPPPNTRAVLNLSPNPDEFTVEEYRWRPLHAGSAPTVPWLREQVEFIGFCRRAGMTVFVHCDAGIDRSALVVIAYFMWQKRITSEEASEWVCRKRSVVRPNPIFRQLLQEWGRSLGI